MTQPRVPATLRESSRDPWGILVVTVKLKLENVCGAELFCNLDSVPRQSEEVVKDGLRFLVQSVTHCAANHLAILSVKLANPDRIASV